MKLRDAALSTLIASTLIGAPVVAQAASATTARAAADVEGEQLAGMSWGVALAAIIAIVVGVIIISDSDEDPASP